MSKELKLFQQIVKGYTEMFNMAINHPKDTIVKWEGVEEIEKALKALEIIKKKQVNIKLFFEVIELEGNAEMYNKYVNFQEWRYLTQEEFDYLKEVLL